MRHTVWPRKGFLRPFLYRAKCALRLRDSVGAIAIGVAAGTFVSFTPLMGLHIALACALAWLLRGNLVAAVLGTAVGNPFTFPAIWLAAYRLGSTILGRSGSSEGAARNLHDVFLDAKGPWHEVIVGMWHPLIWPMMVGGVPLGLLAGAVAYAVTRQAATSFQAGREKRLARRDARRAAASERAVRDRSVSA